MTITSDPNGSLCRVGLRVEHRRTGLEYTASYGRDQSNNLPVARDQVRTEKPVVYLELVERIYLILMLKCTAACNR